MVSTGLSVYRDKTTISNFASAGGKTGYFLSSFYFIGVSKQRSSIENHKQESISLEYEQDCSMVAPGFCCLLGWLSLELCSMV